MMKELIDILHEGNYSSVIFNDNIIRTFTGRGVSDLYDLLKLEPEFLKSAFVADKVIGRAAAGLLVSGNVEYVYTDLISEPALSLLQEHNIKTEYLKVVPFIENRDKTGWCPLESACFEKQVSEILPIIDNFIGKMRGTNMK